jgi:hypothetical protein
MIVAEETETCQSILIYDEAYFIIVHLLVCHICVNGNEHLSTTTGEEFFDRVTDSLPTAFAFSFMELINCLS